LRFAPLSVQIDFIASDWAKQRHGLIQRDEAQRRYRALDEDVTAAN
jgi:hypothetical protein